MDYDALFAHIRNYLDLGSTDYSDMLYDLKAGDLKVLTESQRSQRQELSKRLRELRNDHDGSSSPIDYVPFVDANRTTISLMDEGDVSADNEAMSTGFVGAADNTDEEAQSVETAAEPVDEPQVKPFFDESPSPSVAEDHSAFGDVSGPESPANITGTYQMPAVSREDDPEDDPYEDLFKSIAEDLKKPGLMDFNGRLRRLKAILNPQDNLPAAQYETFLQLRDALYDRRQNAFNQFKRRANEAYQNPELDLDKKIAALDKALDPRFAVEEEAEPLRRRRDDLAQMTAWSEEKAQVYLAYVQHNVNQKQFSSDTEEYNWLTDENGRLDALLSAETSETVHNHAQQLRRGIEAKRTEIAPRIGARSSRVADRNYVRVIKDAEENRRKHIYDEITKKDYEIADFISLVEKEYSDYAKTTGKGQLCDALGLTLSLVETMLLTLDQNALKEYAKACQLNPNQGLEDIRISIEKGLVHLLPAQNPHLVPKLHILQDRTRNPKAIAFGNDKNSEREFEALTVLLPALLGRVEQIEAWERDKSLDSLLKMYGAWPQSALKKELSRIIKRELAPLDDLWASFKDEYTSGKLWRLYPTKGKFEARLGSLERAIIDNPVFKVFVAEDHPYYDELTQQRSKLTHDDPEQPGYREQLDRLRTERGVIDREREEIASALEDIRAELAGGAALNVDEIKIRLGEWRIRIVRLKERYHHHADDLLNLVTNLESQADTKTSDEQLARELSSLVVNIYADKGRREGVSEWDAVVQRAAERFGGLPNNVNSDAAIGHVIYLFAAARSAYLNAKSAPATDEGYEKREDWLQDARVALDSLNELLPSMRGLPRAFLEKQKIQEGWVTRLNDDIKKDITDAESAKQFREQFEAFERQRRIYRAQLDGQRQIQFAELVSYTQVVVRDIIPQREEHLANADPQAYTALQMYLPSRFAPQWDEVLEGAIAQFMNALSDQPVILRMAGEIREAFVTASGVGVRLEKSLAQKNQFDTLSRQIAQAWFEKGQAQVDQLLNLPFDIPPLEHWVYEALFDQANADVESAPTAEVIHRQGQIAAYFLLSWIQQNHIAKDGRVQAEETRGTLARYIEGIAQNWRFDGNDWLVGSAVAAINRPAYSTLYILRDAYVINYASELQSLLTNRQSPTDALLNLRGDVIAQAELIHGTADVTRIGGLWAVRLEVLHVWSDGGVEDATQKILNFMETEGGSDKPQDKWALWRHTETMRSLRGALQGLAAKLRNMDGADPLRDLDTARIFQQVGRDADAQRGFTALVRDQNRMDNTEKAVYTRLKAIIEVTLPASLGKAYAEIQRLNQQVATLVNGVGQQRGATLDAAVLQRLNAHKKRLDKAQEALKIANDQLAEGIEHLLRVIRGEPGANTTDWWNTNLPDTAKNQVVTAVFNFSAAVWDNWPYNDPVLGTVQQPSSEAVGAEDYTKFKNALTEFSAGIQQIGTVIRSIKSEVNQLAINNPVEHYTTLVGEIKIIGEHLNKVNQSLTEYGFNNESGDLFRIPDRFFMTGLGSPIRDVHLWLDKGFDNSPEVRWAAKEAGFGGDQVLQALGTWMQRKDGNGNGIARLDGFADHALVFALMLYRAKWWQDKLDNFVAIFVDTYCSAWTQAQDWIHYTRAVEAVIRTNHRGQDLPEVHKFNLYCFDDKHKLPSKAGTLTAALNSTETYKKAEADLQRAWEVLIEQGDEIPTDFEAILQGAHDRLYKSEIKISLLDPQSSYAAEIRRDFPPEIHRILESPILTNGQVMFDAYKDGRSAAAEQLRRVLNQFRVYNEALKDALKGVNIPHGGNGRQKALETVYRLQYALWVLLDDDTPDKPKPNREN